MPPHSFFVAKRQSEPDPDVIALGRRIDAIATEKDIDTTQLQKAAGVTWAAADRWRKGKARPKIGHLRAIARVLGVKLDDLLGPEDYEPPYAAWLAFLETPTGKEIARSPERKRWLATQYFPDDEEPTVATYLTLAEAARTLIKAS